MRTLIPALLMAVALVPACRSSRMAESTTITPQAVPAAVQPAPSAFAQPPLTHDAYLWA